MLRTWEAVLDERGMIDFLESIDLPKKKYRVLVTILAENAEVQEGLRPYGLCAGQFTVPEDFNDPLPDEILGEFEGA